MLLSAEHLPVLAEAREKASTDIQKQLNELMTKNMYEVSQLQERYRRIHPADRNEFESMIVALPLLPPYIQKLAPSRDIVKRVRKTTSANAMRNLIRLDNVSGFLQMFRDILVDKNSHPFDRVLSLCLLTGRRSCEILCTGRFDPVKGTTFCAEFHGQLKTQGKEKVFVLPLLAPLADVQRCMEDVRRELHLETVGIGYEDEDKRRSTNNLSARLCYRLSELTAEYSDSKITTHNLRALYTVLAWYCSRTECPYPLFAKHILGHVTALCVSSYDKFRIAGLDALTFVGDFTDSHLMESFAQ
jgi:integrase